MVGVTTSADFDVKTAADRLGVMLSAVELDLIAQEIGSLVENQTRNRLFSEKQSPLGAAWAPWSDSYAATRKPQHSLLIGDGLNNGLLESISFYVTGREVTVGSDLPYAAVHQLGSEDGATPGRPYLGLSQDNRHEIEHLVVDLLGAGLR